VRHRVVLASLLALSACAGAAAAAQDAAASPPPALEAAVDALERRDTADTEFRRLLARIDAEGTPALKARAHALQCQRNVGADPEAMRAVAEAGIALARKSGAQAELGGLLLCRGYIEESADRGVRALEDYAEAIAVSARAGKPGDAAQARVLRGELLHAQGRYAEALTEMQAAHRHYVAVGNVRQQSYTLNAIANLYADPRVAQYEKALQYYRQLLARHVAAGNRAEEATARHNIAATLGRLGREREALSEFRAALAVHEAEGARSDAAETRRAMAALLLRGGRAAEALPLAEQALREADGGDESLVARIRTVRAGALYRLGRGDAALAEFDAVQPYFEREKDLRFLEHIAGERAAALSAMGRWQEAFDARSRQFELSRELDRRLEQDVTARMRVQFDSERTERENAALQRENALRSRALQDAQRIRRLQAAVIALGGAVLAGALWVAWRLRRRARLMRRLAMTDELTGIPNRRAILDRLQRRIDRGGAPAAVLIFDIDHFKTINDRRGHDIGDRVLHEVADAARRALAAAAREAQAGEAVLGRIGGEEFLALLDRADAASADEIGERLRAAIAALPIAVDGDDGGDRLMVTISLGGTLVRPRADRIEDALKRADLALYRAKEAGRNRMDWQPAPDDD
jgi:diguanylate cyclase (GGDEF)-like protein